jgi:hypothetical protein
MSRASSPQHVAGGPDVLGNGSDAPRLTGTGKWCAALLLLVLAALLVKLEPGIWSVRRSTQQYLTTAAGQEGQRFAREHRSDYEFTLRFHGDRPSHHSASDWCESSNPMDTDASKADPVDFAKGCADGLGYPAHAG